MTGGGGSDFRPLAKWANKVEHVIDIGTADGTWAARCMNACPNARVTGIDARKCALSSRVANSERYTRIVQALDAYNGTATLRVPSRKTTTSLLKPRTPPAHPGLQDVVEHEIDTVTLDSLRLETPSLTMIKMDVQGLELFVVRGGQTTFRNAHIVFAEVILTPVYLEQTKMWELCAALQRLGYRYAGNARQSYRDGVIWVVDALFVKEDI